MAEELFDRTEEYEAMLNRGIGLSGESQDFFIEGRVQDLASQLPRTPTRILDFGCGVGKTCAYLAEVFPSAYVMGVDLSDASIEYATRTFSSKRIGFARLGTLPELEPFDLVYVNGVFHHISPEDRQEALSIIRRALAPGGLAAIFENNPWNPGARMVMHRIPFDRDAVMLSVLELRRRMKEAGMEVLGHRSLFYCPRFLAPLRFVEKPLAKVPLGAQYYVLARASLTPHRST
jgi:SAM-dependent methyltransferase